MRAFDDNGDPIAGAYVKFFQTATTTPTPVYSNGAITVSLGVKVTSNAAGVFPAIYGDPSIVYRMQMFTAETSPGADDGVLISDDDPIHPHVAFPSKTGAMFFGSAVERDAAYPPALWALCDGSLGTPDTRDRGPVGVSNTKAIGTTGGVVGTANTSTAGSHNHTGSTGSTTLDPTNLPEHNHRIYAWNVNGSNTTLDGFGIPGFNVSVAGELASGGAYIDTNAFGTPIIEDTGEAPGAAVGHVHTLGADGSHFHTVAGSQSPYFTTWFLMRK
ncbi:MAG: hypothetical protein ACREB0_00200 [Sphingopyxis sp.]